MTRVLVFILVLMHGIIHLFGFVQAFKLAVVKQLPQSISKVAGVFWLLATIAFTTTALLFIFKNNYWWVFAVSAVIISQTLTFMYWKEAKFASIINLAILLLAIVGYKEISFYNIYQQEKSFAQIPQSESTLLTESDIATLPVSVKMYIRYSGAIGNPKVNNFNVLFSGKIRKNEQSKWMPFSSEQYNFMQTSTRLFFLNASMNHIPVAGFHCFKEGKAYMDIRLISTFKVQYASGAIMDTSETVTFFNDMCCMAPATLIDKRITWLSEKGNEVKASFTINKITITAWLYFNDRGELINFISNDRYSTDAGKKLPWSTPLSDYELINGRMHARNAETTYSYSDRDETYGIFETKVVEYNVKE